MWSTPKDIEQSRESGRRVAGEGVCREQWSPGNRKPSHWEANLVIMLEPFGGDDDDDKGPPKQSSKKMKFVPIVKKKKDKKGGNQKKKPGNLAPGNNVAAFQDLMQAAQSEADWEGGFGWRPKDVQMGSVAFGARSVGGHGTSGMGTRSAWGGSSGPSNPRAQSSSEGPVRPASVGDRHASVVKSEKAGDPVDQLGNLAGKKNKHKQSHMDMQMDYNTYYPTMLSTTTEDESVESKRPLVKDLIIGSDHLEDGANTMYELGLDGSNTGLMLFQLPGVLPVASEVEEEMKLKKKPAQGKVQGASGITRERIATKPKNIPSGKIGKLLVFKSGKVKMRIGETLLDVSPGVPYPYRQDAVAVHEGDGADEGHCMFMGSVGNKAVCTLDVFQLLSDGVLPDFKKADSNPLHDTKMDEDKDGILPTVKTEYQDKMDRGFQVEDRLLHVDQHSTGDGAASYGEERAAGGEMDVNEAYGYHAEQSGGG